jgi:hypothetical protein
MEIRNVIHVLETWPYFVLLALGIAVTEIYLLQKRNRRRAWTWGWGILGDLACAYLTVQFYALITIFARPSAQGSFAETLRLFLIGLGIHIAP